MSHFLSQNEDLLIEENEHQQRLMKCKQLFSDINFDEINKLLVDIVGYLHDTWSAIRIECSKSLAKIVPHISKDNINKMVKELTEYCRVSSIWQEIHGSLLGLSALVLGCDANQYYKIESVCLILLGHVSTPVRESSRSCLFSIQKRVNDQHNFVFKLIFLVNSVLKSSNTSTESATLTLDGILGCLIDSFQEFPDLIIQFDVPITNSCTGNTPKCESQYSRINQPTIEFVETIQLCMGHVASSVRQKAGQVLTIILKNLMFPPSSADVATISRSSSDELSVLFACALFDYIASKVLMESLRSEVPDDWRLQEVCLMVVEDMLRGVLQSALKRSGLDGVNTFFLSEKEIQTVVMCLVAFLKDSLCLVLCHASFEVRRMATQLLPLLARVAVVLHCEASCAVISLIMSCSGERKSIDDLGAPLIMASYSSDSAGGHPNERSVTFNLGSLDVSNASILSTANRTATQDQLLTLTNITWLAELLKQNQHLLEALAPCGASQYATPLENWSLEGPGRLFEMEHRVGFQKDIRAVVGIVGSQKASINTDCPLFSQLVNNCDAILRMISELLLKFQSLFNEPLMAQSMDESEDDDRPLTLLTGDCIECVALILSFLVNLQARFTPQMTQSHSAMTGVLSLSQSITVRCKLIFSGWLRRVCLIHSLGESTVSRVINMNIADSSTSVKPRSRVITATSALLELLDGSDSLASDVTFIPSVTDPAINPGAFFDTHEEAPRSSHNHNASMYSKPNTPSHSRSQHHANTTNFGASPHSTFTRSSTSPATTINITPKPVNTISSTGGSHSAFGSHRYSINNTSGMMGCSGYQSMDRWNCEAVSPLMGCLVRLELNKDCSLMLCVLLVEWLISCTRNSLWLDGKAFSKKNLFETLNSVLTSLLQQHNEDENEREKECTLSTTQTFYLSVQIFRGIAEVLWLKQSGTSSDLKHVVSLLRSSNALSSLIQSQLQTHEERQNELCVDDILWTDTHSLLLETTSMLTQSTDHFTEMYSGRDINSHSPHGKERHFSFTSHTQAGSSLYASLKSLMVTNSSNKSHEPHSAKSNNVDGDAEEVAASQQVPVDNNDDDDDIRFEGEVDDEFSDWDDDEDDVAESGADFNFTFNSHTDPLMCTQDSVTLSVDANRGVLLSALCAEVTLLQRNCAVLSASSC